LTKREYNKMMKSGRVRQIAIPAKFFMRLLALDLSTVTTNIDLPEDAILLGVRYCEKREHLDVLIWSSEFEKAKDNAPCQDLEVYQKEFAHPMPSNN
jgi:hypothetical protein